jgi:hypothetical protein
MTCFHKRRSDQEDFYEDNEHQVTPLWRQPHRDFSPENQYGYFVKSSTNTESIHSSRQTTIKLITRTIEAMPRFRIKGL